MGMLDLAKGISAEPHNKFTVIMGKPGSGKTTIAGTYPKPILYVSVDTDGGGEVLKGYSDDEIKTIQLVSDTPGKPDSKHVQAKLLELIRELKNTQHPYKTVVIDAYSSIEEGLVLFLEKVKNKKLNLDERGSVASAMLTLRNEIIEASRGDVEYVAICHIKDKKTTDNTTGEESLMIVPKMSYNNGNLLLERASNVMYASKRTVINDDNTRRVAFLAYIGAHPNIDTKLRTKGKLLSGGVYVEDLTYNKLKEIVDGKQTIEKIEKLNVVESQNPFGDDTEIEQQKGEDW